MADAKAKYSSLTELLKPILETYTKRRVYVGNRRHKKKRNTRSFRMGLTISDQSRNCKFLDTKASHASKFCVLVHVLVQLLMTKSRYAMGSVYFKNLDEAAHLWLKQTNQIRGIMLWTLYKVYARQPKPQLKPNLN